MVGRGAAAPKSDSSIRVDDSHWPLALCTLQGTPRGDEVDSWLEQMGALFARGKRFVLLADVATSRPDLAHLRGVGAWAQKHRDSIRRTCVGVAVIVKSPWQRFLMSAFYMVAPPPYPMSVFDDRRSAAAWLRDRLEEDGLAVPPYLESLS